MIYLSAEIQALL